MALRKIKNQAIIAAVIASSVALSACTNKETKDLKKFLEMEKFEKASDLYEKSGEKIKYDNIVGDLETSANDVYEQYMDDDMSYEKATANLEFLLSMAEDDLEKNIQEKKDTIEKIQTSRENFAKGQSLYDSELYLDAIACYDLVVEEDAKNYSEAKTKKALALDEYKLQVETNANSYAYNRGYSYAINYVREEAKNLDDAKAFDTLIAELQGKYKLDVIERADDYASNKNYSDAISYLKEQAENFDDPSIFDDKIATYTDKLIEQTIEYSKKNYADKGYYLDAINYLKNQAESMDDKTVYDETIKTYTDKYAEQIIDNAKKSYADNNRFLDGIEYLKNQAENFDDKTVFDKTITEYEGLYSDDLIKKAETEIKDNDNLEGAIKMLEDAKENIKDTKKLDDKLKELYELAIDNDLAEAKGAIDAKNYYAALVSLNSLSERYKGNEKYDNMYNDASKAYIDDILPVIDGHIEKEDYANAYIACSNALAVLPEDKELNKRMETILPLKPTLLSEMQISESAYFDLLTNEEVPFYTDVIGNNYVPTNLFQIHLSNPDWNDAEEGYAKIYLGAQYKSLNGTAVLNDNSETGTCNLIILADDEVIYNQPYDRTTIPQAINLDVTDKQWIEFKITYPEDNSSYVSNILLSGFCLSK